MRRILSFIFAIFYSLASSGTSTLLHFCGHEQNMHLSIGHEDHHKIPSCCNSRADQCETPLPNEYTHLDEDDCCVSSSIELDESQYESQEFCTKSFVDNQKQLFVVPKAIGAVTHIVKGPVRNNGPPLYLKYQQIIVYS